ncbi:MAG: hypothetical protein ACR2MQ_04740 [Gemmatimonadaceae bacterium]
MPATPTAPVADTAASVPASALPYTGHDAHGIPHYVRRTFTQSERDLLRQVYGVENPNRLYVSDSTDTGLLKYDTQLKRCRTCYVNSYRVGFVSIRRPGESWDQLERRVRGMKPSDFPRSAHVATVSLAALDPDIQPYVARMLADARTAGFHPRVLSTYRTPEREAYLMAIGGRRTHTLTSLHSYGRAIDISIGDGNLSHHRTRAAWIAFRKWVMSYRGGEFRIIGTAAHTWDWNHSEIPSERVGFRSIDAAIARARICRKPAADGKAAQPGHGGAHGAAHVTCDFQPHLP